jgi:dihydrolipoamide dehydrogenase
MATPFVSLHRRAITNDQVGLCNKACTDPEVAWIGLTEDQSKVQGIKIKKSLFPWTASGRTIANGRDEGFTKLLFDDSPASDAGGEHRDGGRGRAR